jgi:penicillin-binding protein 2
MQPESIGLKSSTLATIRAGLAAVVREGTAQQLNDGSIPLTAGKTGTAEVPGGEDNSLYVGYGPVQDPKIAIAVVVERGGFGAEAAVPMAHEIYKTFFKSSKSTPITPPVS